MDLAGKAAVITGAAEGIGRSFAAVLLQKGAKVSLLDFQGDKLAETHKELADRFGNDYVISHVCDVTSEADLKTAFTASASSFGYVDIMLNNAGTIGDVDYLSTINVNYVGVIRGTYLALEHMDLERGGRGGVVINTASVAGFLPLGMDAVYAGTKHAVLGFTRSLGLPHLFSRKGVRVMCICPGHANTSLGARDREQRYRDKVEKQRFSKVLCEHELMSADYVGEAILQLLDSGTSGDCLAVLPDREPFIVDLPTYESLNYHVA